jgi:NitT/TauT family transport system substrate-binding protein
MRVRNRLSSVLALSIFTLPLLFKPADAFSSTYPEVKIAVVSWIGYGPLYVAEKMNLFNQYGVHVKLINFSDGALMSGATASDAVNASTLTYDQVIPAVARGLPVKVVMPIDYSDGADAILASDSIKTVADFKDHKVAYNFGTPSEFLLGYALKKHHMGFSDIKKINISAGDIPSALASGSVHIGVTWQPHVSKALSLGDGRLFHVVYSSKDAPGLISDTLTFNSDFIKTKPSEVLDVIKGYIAGMEYMTKHHDKSMKIIAKALNTSISSVESQYTGVKNVSESNMGEVFKKSKSSLSYYTSGAIISQIQLHDKDISRIPQTSTTFDSSFVKHILWKAHNGS